MLCLRCYGAVPNLSKHATQRVQSQGLRAISSRTNPSPIIRQSSRFLTTSTRSISTQSSLLPKTSPPILSSEWRTTSRASASAFPSLSPTTSTFTSFQPPSSAARSFSASPYLGAKRDTYNPSRRVQKRRHGYLARLKSRVGRKVLMRRRAKGRKTMSW